MAKLARKIGAWAAGLAGLALTSGCASTRVEPAAVRPAYSSDASTPAEPISGPRIEESKLEESADEGEPNKRPLFRVGLSFEPTYYRFNTSIKVPPPPSTFPGWDYGVAELTLTDVPDIQLSIGPEFNIPLSEKFFARTGSFCVWNAQSHYTGSGEKKEGDASVEKPHPYDMRPEGSSSRLYVRFPLCSWSQELGVGLNVGQKSAITLSGNARYYNGLEVRVEQNVVEGLMNPTTTTHKLMKSTWSGWGFGANLRYEGSNCFFGVGAERANIGDGLGGFDTVTLSVGGKW